MQRIIISLAFALAACDGTATKQDDVTSHDPNPNTQGFVEVAEKELITTPYMTQWKLNELFADTTGHAGVSGNFTFTPLGKSELEIGFEEVQVTECDEPGGSNPSYVLVRADGSRAAMGLEQRFTVDPQEAVKLVVSLPNLAKCHSIDVAFGVLIRAL